jgi:hypothetical protein
MLNLIPNPARRVIEYTVEVGTSHDEWISADMDVNDVTVGRGLQITEFRQLSKTYFG